MRSGAVQELYESLVDKGFPEAFAELVAGELNTEFTAGRMLGWLRYQCAPRPEDVADELLAILADRDRIIRHKESEAANARWNELVWGGLFEGEE